MSIIINHNQQTNSQVWPATCFLQVPSDNKVSMENLDEQLKANISSILNTESEETIIGIIHALKYAGLQSLSDLQFVQEEDLILVLKPIQRRKLVKAWHEQSANDNSLADISTASESSYTPSSPSTSITTNPDFIAPSYEPSYIPPPTISNNLPLKDCTWKKEQCFELLKTYAMYKKELNSSSDTDQQNVWGEIADEFRRRCSVNVDELGCFHKINALRSKYQTIKSQNKISKSQRIFLNKAINAFEDDENSDVFPDAVINNSSRNKCSRKNLLKLLEIYANYKEEFSESTVKKQMVWKKIANEFRKKSHLNFNALQCCNKIDELKQEYEQKKNGAVTNKSTALLLDLGRKCFEATDNQISLPSKQSSLALSQCLKDEAFGLNLIKLYIKYKAELDSPDIEEQKVWERIVTELRERYLYDCGVSICKFKISSMRHQYENLKMGKRRKPIYFFEEAHKAFENRDASNHKVDKVGKYIPPHLRNMENKLDGSTISSKTIDRSYKIKVSNLSNDVRTSDLQILFMPFGAIAHLQRIENELDESKCFAYLTFLKQEDASQAILAVDGVIFNETVLKVEWAEPSQTDEISKN